MFVLDTCALIALIRKEPGTDVVEGAIRETLEQDATIVMNKVNLLDVYYDTYRLYDKETADKLVKIIGRLPILIKSKLSDDVFNEAGRLKASYRISIADSIALAESSVSGGKLLTSDHHEFDVIEKSESGMKIHWIR